MRQSPLVPAKAGTQSQRRRKNWIPAFAGMSGVWGYFPATLPSTPVFTTPSLRR
jgi:hypothetical protein